jgi:hypothetical protein
MPGKRKKKKPDPEPKLLNSALWMRRKLKQPIPWSKQAETAFQVEAVERLKYVRIRN